MAVAAGAIFNGLALCPRYARATMLRLNCPSKGEQSPFDPTELIVLFYVPRVGFEPTRPK